MGIKEKIIVENNKIGLKTSFYHLNDKTLGYVENDVIYLNTFYDNDLEIANKHEVLHCFESSKSFRAIKSVVLRFLKDEELRLLRELYKFKYHGLYSETEIAGGILDNEIVIDIIVKNGKFPIDIDKYILNAYETIVHNKNGMKLSEYARRYLSLNVPVKYNQQFGALSKWEKLFVANYYNGKTKLLPTNKATKIEDVKRDISKALEEVYELANNEEYFKINYDSKEILREYETKLSSTKSKGKSSDLKFAVDNKEAILKQMSERYSRNLFFEYCLLVDLVKDSDYEDAFKYLVLNETLSKIYRREVIDGEKRTIVEKRDINNSIKSHMCLDEDVLRILYRNVDNYDTFANLYFAGLAVSRESFSKKSDVSIDINTSGYGRWIKFEGKGTNEAEYIKNAMDLALLVSDTPWCTRECASYQLEQGDFFVFVDDVNKPHVAIKMYGNRIDEVRGVRDFEAQDLEAEYRDVAIEFLKKNKNIEMSSVWLEKELWNKSLIKLTKKIENHTLGPDDVDELLEDFALSKDYDNHGEENFFRNNLLKLIKKDWEYVSKTIFDRTGYKADEMFFELKVDSGSNVNSLKGVKAVFGNFWYLKDAEKASFDSLDFIGGDAFLKDSKIQTMNGLRSISGNARFDGSQIKELNKLSFVGKELSLGGCEIKSLNALKCVNGSLNVANSSVVDIPNLERVGFNFDTSNTKIKSLKNLTYIGHFANFSNSSITDLSSLTYIGGSAKFENSVIERIDKLEEITDGASFKDSKLVSLKSLKRIGGDADFGGSIVSDVRKLEEIGKNAIFCNSSIRDLPMLKVVEGKADFSCSNVRSLPKLKRIGKGADFRKCFVEDLSSLEEVKGDVYFDEKQVKSLVNLKVVSGKIYVGDKMVSFKDLDRMIKKANGMKLKFSLRDLFLNRKR